MRLSLNKLMYFVLPKVVIILQNVAVLRSFKPFYIELRGCITKRSTDSTKQGTSAQQYNVIIT